MIPSLISDLAFFVFGIFYLPFFLLKLRQAANAGQLIRERFGFFSPERLAKIQDKKILWIHAVSVGEVMAIRQFLADFLTARNDFHVVLTTVTPTGQKIAKEMEGTRVSVSYFPFDFTFAVRKFFNTFRPKCLILVETEIWPNLLMEATRAGVPVGILNARLSRRSVRRYNYLDFCLRPLFESLRFVLAQTDGDAERFSSLGVAADRICVTGNIKFDNAPLGISEKVSVEAMKKEWHFEIHDRIWIAGSTHPGEEEILLKVFCELREKIKSLKMIIAPRHIERSRRLAACIRRNGLKVHFATDTNPQENFDVLVLDRLGVLKQLYAIANVVFVGGSLIRRGGQNPIEPACFKRPILHGPHVFNFEKIYQTLDQHGGALPVRDESQLLFALERLLRNEKECDAIGANALAVVEKLRGATTRSLEWILGFLSPATEERMNDVEFHAKLFPPAGGRL